MNIVYVALLSLFIFLLSDTINLEATDFTVPDNRSLSLLNRHNGNETLVLQGATLIDGAGTPPKTDAVIIIYNNEIIAVTNQTNYQYNSSFNDSNKSLTNERVLNLTGKYIIPGLFDMHAPIAGVRKNSYDLTIGKSCKTVPRTVPLINSIPFVKDWIQEHPTGNNRNSFLFISHERQSVYRNIPLNPMSVANMYRQLKLERFPRLLTDPSITEEEKNKIRILLEKPWNPYVRRHTALTEKWKLLKSEQALRMHTGWSKTSKMVEIYTHELGNESSQILLQAYGIIPTDGIENNILKPLQCPHCNEPNKPDSRFCAKCNMILTYDAYIETLEDQKQKEESFNAMEKQVSLMQSQLQNLISALENMNDDSRNSFARELFQSGILEVNNE